MTSSHPRTSRGGARSDHHSGARRGCHSQKGLIVRLPGRNVYRITPDGQRFAVFYTKLHNRLLRPLMAADAPPAPLPLRQALRTIDRHIDDYLDQARVFAA